MSRFLICALLICALAGCAGRPGAAALKKGARALEKGKYAESAIWLQRALPQLAAPEERAAALNCLGIAYYKSGRPQAAAQAFAEAGAANPGASEPIYNLGIVCFENGNDDKAVACFEKAALLNGGAPRALEFLAAVYGRQQQWDDARRILNEANRNYAGRSPRLLTALALTELQAGNTNQALEFLQKALEQDARYAPAIYNLGVINRRTAHKQTEALPLLAEYLRLKPAGTYADQARLMIGEIKSGAREKSKPPAVTRPPARPTEAPAPAIKKETGPAEAAVPVPSTPYYPSFEELLQVAGKLEQQGRREAAFNNYLRITLAAERAAKANIRDQALRRAAALADGNPQAAYDLGVYYLERNKKNDAALYFKTAADQNTNQYVASMALARLSLEKNDYDAAILSFKKAANIRADDPEALWLLAELYDQRLGLTNAAIQAYGQFHQRFANDRRATNAVSRLMAINPGFKPPAEVASGQPKNPPSFWQRAFGLASTNQ